jgi:hypothetical protein
MKKFIFFLIFILLVAIDHSFAQQWTYNFGSGGSTSYTTSNTSSTSFLPTPSSGTSFVRVSNGLGGGFYLDNPGLAAIGKDAELRIVASTGISVNKFSIYSYTGGKSFYTKFSIIFGNSSGGQASTGNFYFFQGNGATYSNGSSFASGEVFTGLQWVYGASGAVSTKYRGPSDWTTLGSVPFSQTNVYTVEIFGNNLGAGSTINYIYNGSNNSVANLKQDIWINGNLIGNELDVSGLSNNVDINSFMFYGINSDVNEANIFLDDITYSNYIASSYTSYTNYYSKSSGYLNLTSNWTTNQDGTGTLNPGNFTTAYNYFNIANNLSPTLGANWVISGSNSKAILGDGTTNCTFTIPSNYTLTGTIDVSNNSTLKLQNTTLPVFGTLNSGSTVEYNQSSSVNITGTSYGNLKINTTGGTPSLGGNLMVSGNLVMSNGLLDLNHKNISLGTTGTLSETGTSYIKQSQMTSPFGTISAVKNLNAPSGSDIAGLGVKITSSANLGSTTIIRGVERKSDAIGNLAIARYYDIVPTNNTGLNATAVYNYNSTEIGGITEGNLVIFKSTDNGSTWTQITGTLNTTDKTITVTGINDFSVWTLGDKDAPLPVELASFTANVFTRDVKLNWTTETEINNSGFEIERAEVGSQNSEFRKISFVSGNGTKNTPTDYSFEDKKLNTGKYNYRLKQIDYNGNFVYHNLSATVEIGVPKKYDVSQNYPNPFNPVTKIDFDLPFDSKVSIRLYDITGREIKTLVNETKQAGYYTTEFNGSNISSGTYFYRIVAEGNGQKYVMTKKLMLLK